MEETEKGLGDPQPAQEVDNRVQMDIGVQVQHRSAGANGEGERQSEPALKRPQGGGTRAQCQLDRKEMKFLACSPARVTFPGPCSGRTRAC